MNIVRLFPESNSTSLYELKRVANTIQEGGIVIIPTDTVYGMACDATNEGAVSKIFQYKQRHYMKPLSVFVRSLEHAQSYAQFGPAVECFLKKVWPGHVTVVLNKRNYPASEYEKLPRLAENLTAGKTTVGFRYVDYPFIKDLFELLQVPIVATSANISGRPAENSLGASLRQFDKKVVFDLLIDGGTLPRKDGSTIIDISRVARPKILRGRDPEAQELLTKLAECREEE